MSGGGEMLLRGAARPCRRVLGGKVRVQVELGLWRGGAGGEGILGGRFQW